MLPLGCVSISPLPGTRPTTRVSVVVCFRSKWLEERRKDYLEMMVHHVLTVCLVLRSLISNELPIGLMVLACTCCARAVSRAVACACAWPVPVIVTVPVPVPVPVPVSVPVIGTVTVPVPVPVTVPVHVTVTMRPGLYVVS